MSTVGVEAVPFTPSIDRMTVYADQSETVGLLLTMDVYRQRSRDYGHSGFVFRALSVRCSMAEPQGRVSSGPESNFLAILCFSVSDIFGSRQLCLLRTVACASTTSKDKDENLSGIVYLGSGEEVNAKNQ
jgi:hypothetical protein